VLGIHTINLDIIITLTLQSGLSIQNGNVTVYSIRDCSKHKRACLRLGWFSDEGMLRMMMTMMFIFAITNQVIIIIALKTLPIHIRQVGLN